MGVAHVCLVTKTRDSRTSATELVVMFVLDSGSVVVLGTDDLTQAQSPGRYLHRFVVVLIIGHGQ